jgi:hypothetical protein
MRRTAIGALLVLVTLSASAMGQETPQDREDGNWLLRGIESTEKWDKAYTFGFIIGATVAFELADPPLFEIPEGVRQGQVRDVVKRYLETHPEKRHESARMQIRNALMNAWPAKKAAK